MTGDVLLLYDDLMLRHDPGPGHPERPDRLAALRADLARRPLPGLRWERPPPATSEQVGRIHSAAYAGLLEALRGRRAALDPDTRLCPESVDAAFTAAGAALAAASAVASGAAARAFALVRPPGHHAEAGHGMGFCLLNNVAIAAAHALAALSCQRVLIVDWDAHHGNGSQRAFYEREDVLVFNTHQSPLYPGTGRVEETGVGAGAGFTVNVPLPPRSGDGDLWLAYRELLRPVAEQFRPDLVLVSAGFDAHRADPLAALEATADGFAALCGVVRDIADRFAGGRLALALEGGYDLEALAQSVRGCLEVLTGAAPPDIKTPPTPGGAAAIRFAKPTHGRRWKL